MPLIDINTTLTEDERAVRDVAQRFATDVLRPVSTSSTRWPTRPM